VAKSFPTVYTTGRRKQNLFSFVNLCFCFFSSFIFQKMFLLSFYSCCMRTGVTFKGSRVNLLNCSFFAVLRKLMMTNAVPCVTGRVRRFRSFPHPFLLSPSIFLSVGKGPQSTQLLLSWNHSRVPSIVISLHNDDFHRR